MELADFLDYLDSGEYVESGSNIHQFMHKVSQEAIRISLLSIATTTKTEKYAQFLKTF